MPWRGRRGVLGEGKFHTDVAAALTAQGRPRAAAMA
ncbi:hypothetical protein CBM2585_A40375 [Cupriavidus taiwanensis]|nr:hypothetical protein CBM2585_A40375 [Cupriavidus taiwanensis]